MWCRLKSAQQITKSSNLINAWLQTSTERQFCLTIVDKSGLGSRIDGGHGEQSSPKVQILCVEMGVRSIRSVFVPISQCDIQCC